ncbi:uncharacterized protein FIBRA_01828 [Fibroporia radiculosa]|uniref:Integrase zinc-binding domain-containing protein n=1 Tax=Fibroporia radiculosa TaxID=599839 RepID=J4H1G3_9APHY|nr:uncharacterized protein FIBRA_01828 [Fibroporia radiculosa]CCL99804.1 predicted protein [Fibroporia radiculosa]
MASPRVRRQERRRAAGYNTKPYEVKGTPTRKRKRPAMTGPAVTKPSGTLELQDDEEGKEKTPSELHPDLGMPSPTQYKIIEEEYISSLHVRKREKALLTQAMFDNIWDVLHDPTASRVGTPQFRWWVRKMFTLSYTRSLLTPAEIESIEALGSPPMPIVLHENRPIALKDQIYEILCYCHSLANHGGRDKTTAVIREHYSWIPKELISQFVRACPTCIFKKTRSMELVLAVCAREDSKSAPPVFTEEEKKLVAEVQQLVLQYPDEAKHVLAHCIPPHVAEGISRDAAPSSSRTTTWQPAFEPDFLHSPVPLHAMPGLHPWLDPALYDSQGQHWSMSGSSHGSSTLVSNASSQAGYDKTYYELAPMRRWASADEPLEQSLLREREIVLPPLTKVLSEGSTDMFDPATRFEPRAPFELYSPHLALPPMQTWSRGSEADHWATTYAENGYGQIDPALLQDDGLGEVPLASPDRVLFAEYRHRSSMGAISMSSAPSACRIGSVESLLTGSSPLSRLSLRSGLVNAYAAAGLDDSESQARHLVVEMDAPRFVFPTSVERQGLDGDDPFAMTE